MRFFSLDYLIVIITTVILIVGAYQFYFWCQRQNLRKRVSLKTKIDDWFPYNAHWIWIYSGLYYPIIVLATLTVTDARHFLYAAFSYFMLLGVHMLFFVFFPVESKDTWRKQVKNKNLSDKFMQLVMKYDKDTNCFPSMHVSVAMLTALHIFMNKPEWGFWIFLFPLTITLSTLYTKRHYFLDTLPGALLGWLVFLMFKSLYI